MARAPRRSRTRKAAEEVAGNEAAEAQVAEPRLEDTVGADDLPADLRVAIRNCDFWIATPRVRRGLDVAELTRRVQAVKTQADADEVNRIIVTQINRVGTGFGPGVPT